MKYYKFRNVLIFFYIFCLFLCFFTEKSAAAQHVTVKEGDCFANIKLPRPFCLEDKKYLGLSDRKSYSFNDIHTRFVLINCFSIYCPICQKHAPDFNQLYKLIIGDNFISKNIKMIGIGMGNNNREVEYYREYFNILFPCIADPDFKIHKALKETKTPLLAIIDKKSNPYKIVSILDFFEKPENLLEVIRAEINNLLKYK